MSFVSIVFDVLLYHLNSNGFVPMLILTAEQAAPLRSELADYPEVLRSLIEIEDCDGDVEDAAVSLAIAAGLEPDNGDRWIISYAKRFRPTICELLTQSSEAQVDLSSLIRHIAGNTPCPPLLVLPVAIAAQENGLDQFCEILKSKLDLLP